jgi:hypothetical protein
MKRGDAYGKWLRPTLKKHTNDTRIMDKSSQKVNFEEGDEM